MLLLGLGLLDEAEEDLREVADDDEGRGQCRAAVVFHNQVVPLELPEDVRVALHHLECVAVNCGEGGEKNNNLQTYKFHQTYKTLFWDFRRRP